MARPRLSPDEKRSFAALVRLNKAEYDQLKASARKSSLPLATFLRKVGLRARVAAPRVPPVNLATSGELHRIGVNLNQLVKLFHSGQVPFGLGSELEELVRTIGELRAELVGLRPLRRDPSPDDR